MTNADLYKALSAIAPTAKIAWPIGSAPDLPWIVYTPEPGYVYADNENYKEAYSYTVGLYEPSPQAKLERQVEEAIAQFAPYGRGVTTYLESEDCYVTEYTFNTIGD